MLAVLNRLIGKWMPLLTPISVVTGIGFSYYLHPLSFIVPWLFAFMTFTGSLRSDFRTLGHSFFHPKYILLALFVLHLMTPLWAWSISHLFFSDEPLMNTGFTLAAVIPTGVTSVMWVALYKGNIPMTLSVVLIDTLLSPIIVPFSIALFVSQKIHLPIHSLIVGLLLMVVIPTVVGMLINEWTLPSFTDKLSDKLSPFSRLTLPLMIAINSAPLAPYLKSMDWHLVKIAGTILFISISGFLFCWLLVALFHLPKDDAISFVFTGGMRNISTGTVIAISFFPPPVAIPVVMGMLFQQTLAGLNGLFIKYFGNKKVKGSHAYDAIVHGKL
ncbi:bile acid:sodium symporter family protein [Sporolactobacillus terrae]|uniref:Bile acid:sodium symporter family protein n=1 Tax=Sporolactobacillus terrae TaxID=269673 RepID=A0A5K7WZJ3_9BACL|nr:bile acid:sodium symporter family protein [Sporolactobacillus terrae]BBN97880.1 hypothetical protein St703_05850 [Sporolactobacillus terrae]